VIAREWSRRAVGEVVLGCWGFLIAFKLARSAVGWSGEGVLFWIVAAPLSVGFVGAGLVWVALAVGDVVHRRRVQAPARSALAVADEAVRRLEHRDVGEELAAALLRRARLLEGLGRRDEAIAAFMDVIDASTLPRPRPSATSSPPRKPASTSWSIRRP
jgi:hypothetical protein